MVSDPINHDHGTPQTKTLHQFNVIHGFASRWRCIASDVIDKSLGIKLHRVL
jgi:hypothetical protein